MSRESKGVSFLGIFFILYAFWLLLPTFAGPNYLRGLESTLKPYMFRGVESRIESMIIDLKGDMSDMEDDLYKTTLSEINQYKVKFEYFKNEKEESSKYLYFEVIIRYLISVIYLIAGINILQLKNFGRLVALSGIGIEILSTVFRSGHLFNFTQQFNTWLIELSTLHGKINPEKYGVVSVWQTPGNESYILLNFVVPIIWIIVFSLFLIKILNSQKIKMHLK